MIHKVWFIRKVVEQGSYKIFLGSIPKSDPASNQKEETREKQNMKKKRNTDFELDRKIFNFSREKKFNKLWPFKYATQVEAYLHSENFGMKFSRESVT